MTNEEIKKAMEEKNIKRKDLAKKIGCSYQMLCSMLTDFTPLKQKWHDRIVKELGAAA